MSGSGSVHQSVHQFVAKVSLLATTLIGGGLAEPVLSMPLPQPAPQVMQVGNPRSLQEADDSVNGLAVIGIALAGSAAIGLGLSAIVDRKRPARLSWGTSAGGAVSHSSSDASLNQVSSNLQRKMLRLLHDDRGAAQRLFAHTSLKYPGKSPNWYAEKIIYDLERDRGKY
jgi:hypothetical protein